MGKQAACRDPLLPRSQRLAVDVSSGSCGPRGDTQEQAEERRLCRLHHDLDLTVPLDTSFTLIVTT